MRKRSLGRLDIEAENDAIRGKSQVDIALSDVGGGRQQEARLHPVLRECVDGCLDSLQSSCGISLQTKCP